MNSLAVLAVLSCVSLASACLDTCIFKLCEEGTVSLKGDSDVALTSGICRGDNPVGRTRTREALVKTNAGKFIEISHFKPDRLKDQISNRFFQTYEIGDTGRFGVGHEVPLSNQARVLKNKCIALPIKSYQKLDKNGEVKEKIVLNGKPTRQCVSFMTVL